MPALDRSLIAEHALCRQTFLGAVLGLGTREGIRFCIQNDGFCIQNDGFCIQNDGFCIQDYGFCTPNDGFRKGVIAGSCVRGGPYEQVSSLADLSSAGMFY